MAIIGVDVDLTIVNSDYGLVDWCSKLSAAPLTFRDVFTQTGLPYEFFTLYPDVTIEQVIEYWSQENLYDDMEPMADSVNTLRELHRDGHQIVFVSALTGLHYNSKLNFLKRHFPFMSGFIGTHQKQFAKVDILIDDRMENLNACLNAGIKPVLYSSPYKQNVEPAAPMSVIRSWTELYYAPYSVYNEICTSPLIGHTE